VNLVMYRGGCTPLTVMNYLSEVLATHTRKSTSFLITDCVEMEIHISKNEAYSRATITVVWAEGGGGGRGGDFELPVSNKFHKPIPDTEGILNQSLRSAE
jgi:hypothetical protein